MTSRIQRAAAALIAALGLVLVTTTPASADDISVNIELDNGVNGVQIANVISQLNTGDRGEFVAQAVSAAFDNDGGDYSVVMQNLSQGHDKTGLFGHEKLYANVVYEGIYYGLWIVDGGSFTNNGDGGYINWGYQGWLTRDGQTLNFYTP